MGIRWNMPIDQEVKFHPINWAWGLLHPGALRFTRLGLWPRRTPQNGCGSSWSLGRHSNCSRLVGRVVQQVVTRIHELGCSLHQGQHRIDIKPRTWVGKDMVWSLHVTQPFKIQYGGLLWKSVGKLCTVYIMKKNSRTKKNKISLASESGSIFPSARTSTRSSDWSLWACDISTSTWVVDKWHMFY